MDSHQISGTQKTPLLLSLYAQASLGLVKNMKKGIVMMESNGKCKELEMARCKTTGLLLLNITRGMKYEEEPFKCHRPFRSHLISKTAMTATAALQCQRVRGQELPMGITVAEHLHGVLKADECVITTRSCDSQLPAISGRPLVSHDARYHFDPGSLSYRSHVGRHPAIIAGLMKHKRFVDNLIWLVQQVIQCPNMIIDVFCKSGRHRSVGEATSLAIILQHLGIKFTLVHCEARERGRGWLTMHCGGGCNECGWFNDDAFDEVKEMLKPICNRIQQVAERMPEYISRRTVPTVDLTGISCRVE